MKKNRRQYFSGLVSGVLLAALISALAAPALALAQQTISVHTGVDVYVDGVKIDPRDVNGNSVPVFLYNGTTYLPVRALSKALGMPIQWDGSTQTVYVGEVPGQKQYLLDVCEPYLKGGYETPATIQLAGKDYAHGFTLACHGGYALFNLDGQYNRLEFDLGYTPSHNRSECDVNIYLDGTFVKNIRMGYEDLPQHISIPLNGALQLKIENVNYGNMAIYGFVNVEIY